MELDDLKDIWKKNDPAIKLKGEAEIATMLKGSSNSIVAKLKRSVWFELIITMAASVVLLIYAFRLQSGSVKWTFVSIVVLFVGYTFYYIKKLALLNKFVRGDDNLKANLEKLVASLTSYLRFYKRSYSILYPVYFFLGLAFVAIERGFDEFIHALIQPRTLVLLTLLAAAFFFCSTWLASWVLKKLYGNHLEKLKGLLNDLSA